MPDYQELYLTLFRASEEAINLLITAQRECEERYLRQSEEELKVVSFPPEPPNRGAGD